MLTTEQTIGGRGRRLAMVALGLSTSALGLLFAFWHVRFGPGLELQPRLHWADLARVLETVKVPWLLSFLALDMATLWLHGVQLWALARRRDGGAPHVGGCCRAVAVSMLAQNLLPARLSEPVRVLALVRAEPVAPAMATGAVLLGRVLDLAALLAATCLPSLGLGLIPKGAPLLHVLALAGSALTLLAMWSLWLAWRRRRPLAAWAARRRPWLGRLIEGLLAGLSALEDRRRLTWALLSSLALPLVLAAGYGCALYAFGLGGLPLGSSLLLVTTVLLAVALPAAPSSVGVYHAAASWTLIALGAPPARAAAFALLTHAVGGIAFVAIGGVALAQLGGRRALGGGQGGEPA